MKPKIFLVLFYAIIFLLPASIIASSIYDFNFDTLGQTPANTTVTAGTFQVNNQITSTNAFKAVTQLGVIAGLNFDNFASSSDYSVVWKQDYSATTGRGGFTLRAQSDDTSVSVGARKGYLFQVYDSNSVYIWKVGASSYSALWSGSLSKATPRWFKAVAIGNQLAFYYSNDGINFTSLATTTDSTYTSGVVQYTAGYGTGVGVDLIDDVVFTNLSGDISAPIISSVSSSTNQTTALIGWSTDENATGIIRYGLTTSYGSTSAATSSLTSQAIRLTGLSAGTTYHFRIDSTDSNSNLATSSDFTFTTKQGAVINPVGYWKLDESASSDDAVDEIGINTGFQSGTPAATTTVPTVNFIDTGSRVFDGNNYFTINRPVQDDFTICAWIKTSSSGGGSSHWTSAPIMDSEWGGLANDFGFGIGNGGKLMYGNGGSFDYQVNGNTVINDNVWHNVCVTRNNTSGAVKLYVDAQLDGSGTTSTGSLNINPYARIGYGYDGAAHYVGLIDDVRAYNTDLSQSQLLSIFQGNNDPSTPPTTSSGGCGTHFEKIGNITYAVSCGARTVYNVDTVIPQFPVTAIATTSTVEFATTSAIVTEANFSPLITPTPAYQFPRNLKKGIVGEDVMKLQQFLNSHGFILGSSGPGSPGLETTLFGSRTEAAVMKFQAVNTGKILTVQNLIKPTGWFYQYTRDFTNKMLAGELDKK